MDNIVEDGMRFVVTVSDPWEVYGHLDLTTFRAIATRVDPDELELAPVEPVHYGDAAVELIKASPRYVGENTGVIISGSPCSIHGHLVTSTDEIPFIGDVVAELTGPRSSVHPP